MRKRARTVLLPLALLVVGAGGAVAAAGCIIDWADDCSHNHGAPGCKGVATGGGGGTGTGSASSTGSNDGGSGGTGAGCTDASSCPPVPPGPCAALGKVTCIEHACGIAYEAGNAPSQMYGSCKSNLCDAMGALTTVVDGGNPFVDGNPCTNDTCVGQKPENLPTPDMPCLQPGPVPQMGGFCEQNPDPLSGGGYACAQCNPNDQGTCGGISGYTCVPGGKCVPPHCVSTTKDADETGVDCGGADCMPCLAGEGCSVYTDCSSLVCTSGKCVAPTCTDGRKNGTETDVDCGGASCSPCGNNLACASLKDCVSQVCMPPGTNLPPKCQPPTCFDGVQNGSETGVDCGGPLDGGGDGDGGAPCPPCAM